MSNLTNRTADIWKLWRKADAEVHRITGAALRDSAAVQTEVLVKRTRDHARAMDHRVAILRHLDAHTGEAAPGARVQPANSDERRMVRAAE